MLNLSYKLHMSYTASEEWTRWQVIDLMYLTSQLNTSVLFLDDAAILSGKKIVCFYTISETQAARNFISNKRR